ncbi:Signal recognition particle, subunit Srp54, partial [Pseudoloma neurophilia]
THSILKDPLFILMLYDLGKSLNDSLQRLFKSQITDSLIDDTVRDIIRQLISNNVSTKCIMILKKNIDQKVQTLKEETNKKEDTTKFNTKDTAKEQTYKKDTTKSMAKKVYSIIFDELINLIDPKKEVSQFKIEQKSQIVMFIGLQGAGKTTTICKYANFYKKKGFKVGIVCADTFRAGAFDQIKQNCLKINVPFYGSNEKDPVIVSRNGIDKFKKDNFNIILIDTSGRHTQENELFKEMIQIKEEIKPNRIILVLDSGIGQSAEKQSINFINHIQSIILTKLDGTERAGGAISSIAIIKCPIEFIGMGEKMEDLEIFNPKRFINKLLGKGDIEGLIEKMNNLESELDQKEIIDKIKKGNFTLKDLQKYLTMFISLGPMSNILKMIPGMNNFADMNILEGSGDLMKQMLYLFDSMTENELNSPEGDKLLKNESRKRRISKGSGTPPQLIGALLQQYETFSYFIKIMGKDNDFLNMMGKEMTEQDMEKIAGKMQKKIGKHTGFK